MAHYTCIALQKVRTQQRARQTTELPSAAQTAGKAKSAKDKKSAAKQAAVRRTRMAYTPTTLAQQLPVPSFWQANKCEDRQEVFERLPSDHPLFARIFELLVGRPRRMGHWLGLAEQAINTIYALAQAPDVICASVIKSLTAQAFGPTDGDGEAANDTEASSEDTVQHDGETVSRLLLVLGHVALKQLIHMEQAQAEIHRRRQNPSSRPASTASASLCCVPSADGLAFYE